MVTHYPVTGSEVREIGRLIIAFSEALGIEPNSVSSVDLCQQVRELVQERDDLREQVEQQHEINAGWVAYGERVKGQRRKYAEDLAAAIGYDFTEQRWLPIEAMIRIAAARFESIGLGQEITSGLLRGMARRAAELRRKYRSLSRSYVRLGTERDEKQFEVERLRRWVDRFRHGMNTAVEERDLLRAQRDELLAATKPNPWFTPAVAEFPIEEAERADRERTSIAYAFPSQEWREEQLAEAAAERVKPDVVINGPGNYPLPHGGTLTVRVADRESPFVPPAIAAMAEVRDRKAEALQQHHETVARIVEQYVTAAEPVADVRAYLLGQRREDCRVDIAFGGQVDDERTVRTEATP